MHLLSPTYIIPLEQWISSHLPEQESFGEKEHSRHLRARAFESNLIRDATTVFVQRLERDTSRQRGTRNATWLRARDVRVPRGEQVLRHLNHAHRVL